ncbi:DUF4386 domain-containing protein [Paenibacillus sp. MABNR03]|uniref:DUF4386 domain-containing protein n=1 Tax=Paenibacillus sp. MABNR03 TaxID=3142626 RepID=UPI003D28B350
MNNRIARVVGILFLVSTVAYLLGSGILNPVLQNPDFLTGLHLERTNVVVGLLLELINAIAVVGIAMLLHPILKKHNEAFALGYFASRVIESVILIISLVCPILLLGLSEDYSAAEASGHFHFQTMAQTIVDAHFTLFELAMFILSLGSLLFCYVLYHSRLVPRFLSIIGFIGYAGLLTSSCLAIAGHDSGTVLYIPGAIFEIMLPLWLIFKGFNLHSEKS